MPSPNELRQERVLKLLDSAVGGYHVDSVAAVVRISRYEANGVLRELAALGKVEHYESRGSRLWRIARTK